MTRENQPQFSVPAETLAEAFDLSLEDVRAGMRAGTLTSRCERGEGADAGRWRLVFFHAGRALRLTVDGEGRIMTRASFDVPGRTG